MSIAEIIYQYLGERELHDNVGLLDCLRPVPQYLATTNGRTFQEPTWVTRPESDLYSSPLYLSDGHDLPHHCGCVLQGWDRIPFKHEATSIPGCLFCCNLLDRWFYIKFSIKVVPKVAASAPAVDIARLRREWKKANVSDIKYQPFKWAGGQCYVHSWFINLFVLNWTHEIFAFLKIWLK